jgi:hypothetical protein
MTREVTAPGIPAAEANKKRGDLLSIRNLDLLESKDLRRFLIVGLSIRNRELAFFIRLFVITASRLWLLSSARIAQNFDQFTTTTLFRQA